ncbi:MAG: hypothetical protein LBF58_10270 [Deltaproteobacteria bacterium]|jgi:hypothetical protein|nr:hypothetical protein [Deltaproteobacteria bacterium]
MKYLTLIALFLLTCTSSLCTSSLFAQSFSASDFVAPAAAATDTEAEALLQVQAPGEVTTETGPITGQPAIKAATPQDAINAYVKQRHASGFAEFRFPSGFGFVAAGSGTYRKVANPTTTRINQRNAYAKAYVEAKKNLAQGFYGLSNEGKNILAESMTNLDTDTGNTLTGSTELTGERIRQRVEGLIRGFVLYEIFDDFDNSTVYVTIVSTPKTQGKIARPDTSNLLADTLIDGLDAVLTEAKKGLSPPVGGRTIFVPSTGELAYVGFGSAAVRLDSDPAIQAKQNLNAERIARIRASDSLCGVILGDEITATSKLDQQTLDIVKDFEGLEADDPLNAPEGDSPRFQALTERKKEFLTIEGNSSLITSVRSGKLPPGVRTEGWRDSDNTFAYAMSVYLPSASDRAAAARDKMLEGSIVNPSQGVAPSGQPGPSVRQGPSGTVQPYEDM